MTNVVSQNTITLGAGAVSGIWSVLNPGPARVMVRTASTGVLVGGQDLSTGGYGYELEPNKVFTIDVRFFPLPDGFTNSGAEATLYVKNTNGAAVTVGYIGSALAS